jgi:uncharacterized membrane protein
VDRAGEKIFGILAIIAGVGIVAAVAAGVTITPVVLVVINFVVVVSLVYYFTTIRQRGGGQRPGDREPKAWDTSDSDGGPEQRLPGHNGSPGPGS